MLLDFTGSGLSLVGFRLLLGPPRPLRNSSFLSSHSPRRASAPALSLSPAPSLFRTRIEPGHSAATSKATCEAGEAVGPGEPLVSARRRRRSSSTPVELPPPAQTKDRIYSFAALFLSRCDRVLAPRPAPAVRPPPLPSSPVLRRPPHLAAHFVRLAGSPMAPDCSCVRFARLCGGEQPTLESRSRGYPAHSQASRPLCQHCCGCASSSLRTCPLGLSASSSAFVRQRPASTSPTMRPPGLSAAAS